jgi:hypothetical protein
LTNFGNENTLQAILHHLRRFQPNAARGYNVRFLSGDLPDMHARQQFRELLSGQLSDCDEERIIDEPICSVEGLVVATLFHNVLLSLLCNKPATSISFHDKSKSLMSAMGFSEYCLDINNLQAGTLMDKFCDLETNSDIIRSSIRAKAREFREALNEQYKIYFQRHAGPGRGQDCDRPISEFVASGWSEIGAPLLTRPGSLGARWSESVRLSPAVASSPLNQVVCSTQRATATPRPLLPLPGAQCFHRGHPGI